ncbi:MAG: helix-turn-helix transcriptional regulator [Elusimicrobia bacterium]|nr:helix-turn-helix transcriptional regulator [Elusimicrobiota bacterium]
MNNVLTPEELAAELGGNIRRLRLQRNVSQQTLSAQAGVSLTALRHLESGEGATLGTLIRVVRALDKQDWLHALAPRVTVNPLHMPASLGARQRARARRSR